MIKCPRCEELVNGQVINCPYCGNELKAFGHPGIPLHQTTDKSFLCDRCIYHHDDTCNFPQRPYAKTCTLFHDRSIPLVEEISLPASNKGLKALQAWFSRNQAMVMLVILLIISILITLS